MQHSLRLLESFFLAYSPLRLQTIGDGIVPHLHAKRVTHFVQPAKLQKKLDAKKQQAELDAIRSKYGIEKKG